MIFNELCNTYSFINNLDDYGKNILKSNLIVENFESSYQIMGKGGQCSGFSLILKGIIRVYKISDKGKEVTLYKLSSGDTCYLSISCMLTNETFPAFAEVIDTAKIVFIPNDIFNKYIYNTLDFQKYMVNNLFQKYIDVINLLEEIAFERMDVRISKYLIDASRKINNSNFLYLTQERISQELGTSREVVTRILMDFKNKDIITTQRGKITIINREKLNYISQL
ncbi:MAG: Crp/Fnr family transcriptional regulator [Paraclostridium sp.]|uniref:Crp/Fnr family transcriptional regulator n=1 Tax=Paraclostridium sp. TaxID=2023273 RepID=UPI003F336CE3